jgi:hypothetical protein
LISSTFWCAETLISTQERRDWSSVLEAIERDITALNNDYKFKRLVAKLLDDGSIHIDDIYTKGWNCPGPWTQIVERIRKEF